MVAFLALLTIGGCALGRGDGDVLDKPAAPDVDRHPTEATDSPPRQARCRTHSIGNGQTLTECDEGA